MKRNSPCLIVVLTLALLAAGAALAAGEGSGPAGKKIFTKHFEKTLFDVTAGAAFSTEVLLDDSEYPIGKKVIGIVVHDARDEDVRGAEITIVHKKVDSGERASGTPVVTDKGNGLYIVSGLDLRREGRWELLITVKKTGLEDSVKFVLPDALKDRVPKGKYSP